MVSVQSLSINFGQRDLFTNLSFFIGEKDRIGLIGKNGAGKSTLMKIIAGRIGATSGQVLIPKEKTIGYLPQEMEHEEEASIIDEASRAFEEINILEEHITSLTEQLSERSDYESEGYNSLIQRLSEANDRMAILGGGNMEQQVQKVLQGLGFTAEDMNRQMKEFSGGWKMRVELAKLLLMQPNVLLLDEPTNHLDIESIEWLESFLKNYSGAIILISHDRVFLDTITNRTVEITGQKVHDIKAPYSKYMEWRAEDMERQEQAYKNQQKYIEDTQRNIDKFRAKKNKAAFAQSLIKKLDKMERLEIDTFENAQINFTFPSAPRSGKVVVKTDDLAKSFDKPVFKDVNLSIARQEKVAFVGKNGAGKTTLTRIILGEERAQGEMSLGHNVDIGYYAQNQSEQLDPSKTVFEVLDDEATGEIRTQLRALLGAFLFSGEDIDKKVSVLSGGEKARLALCKLLLHPYNLLILDEPTNHLDMRSKEMLKRALQQYDGTLIVVSHDRDFLSGLTELVYEVTPTGLKQYIGDIQEFLKEKRASSIAAYEADVQKQAVAKEEKSSNKRSYEERKEFERQKRKLTNAVGKSERSIEELESELAQLQEEISQLDYSNQEAADKVLNRFQERKKLLDETVEAWEQFTLELEELLESE
ncbi:MAG: ABC-F family ATP-binding cassette domain-containing protein [Flavobacteriales bacterium]|nr:ABC-F family ATP-binding cassette domain-containing protein [Flavobacteriales bacterium]MDG1767479.1 ABC-F family ATP-binding cassette domain-containing protein [Flavobacteriales bacterium]